jgi:subtilisin family serine protease
MNRQNYVWHIAIAAVLVGLAALIGQVRRWESPKYTAPTATPKVEKVAPKSESKDTKSCALARSSADKEPEVLVRFKKNVNLEEVKRIAETRNDRLEDEIESVAGLVALDDLDGKSAQEVAEEYAAMSETVEYAEPNFQIKLEPTDSLSASDLLLRQDELNADLPNDPMFGEQWALSNKGQNGGKENADLSAVRAWEKTKGNKKAVIAVLDTGVDYTHQDLVSNIWVRPASVPAYKDDELGNFNDKHGFNSADNVADPMDENGHGTHCAGIIGAEGNNDEGISGINWKTEIMPMKFLGKGGSGSTKDAIEAINYIIDRKKNGVNVRVISASWGSTAYSKALEDVIRKAGDEGILFIAAAGNSSQNADFRPHYPSGYKLPNVISVAALDRNDNLAGFSNYGVKSVHLGAPGKDIISTWIKGTYREASGTSMATPYVSGVAGLILAQDANIPLEKLREKLLASVDPLDSLKGKTVTGGRLNAAKAVGGN